MDSKVVGTRMKQKRLEKKMTQVDVATKSGISSKYYGSIENGKNSPSIEKLSAIAKALGCSLHYLLNDRMEDTENRVAVETKRLQEIFNKIPRDKLSLVEGLIIQLHG
ncbi:DNA-binding protein [Enterococcus faecalis PF3]|nr:DNA-binding protein [Enterococcus faecalis PF3]